MSGANRSKAASILAEVAATVPPKQAARDREGPTPEQRQHGVFRLGDVVDKAANGVTINLGKAYRREPLFETLAKDQRSGIGEDGLRALRYYRARHDESDQSLTRCALDVQGRGGSAAAPIPRGVDPFLLVGAGWTGTLERLEQAMGSVADTVRAVAIEDRTYSDLAIVRWGSRKQSWIAQPKGKAALKPGARATHVEKIVPKSGRHREAIRQEFLVGLARLAQAVQLLTAPATQMRLPSVPLTAGALSDQPIIANRALAPMQIAVDPAFLNDNGHLRDWAEIAEIIRERWSA